MSLSFVAGSAWVLLGSLCRYDPGLYADYYTDPTHPISDDSTDPTSADKNLNPVEFTYTDTAVGTQGSYARAGQIRFAYESPFSVTNYRELESLALQWADLAIQTEAVEKTLPDSAKDACTFPAGKWNHFRSRPVIARVTSGVRAPVQTPNDLT